MAQNPDLRFLETALQQLGCPREKCAVLATQLDKRARQLADRKQRPYEEALAHLLQVMKQGRAAQQKGIL